MSRTPANANTKKDVAKKGGLPKWAWIAMAGGGVAALGAGAYFLFFRKKAALTTGAGVPGAKGIAPGEEEDEEEEGEEGAVEPGMEWDEGAPAGGGGGGGGGGSSGGGGPSGGEVAPGAPAGAGPEPDEAAETAAEAKADAAADAAEAAAEAKAERVAYIQEFAREYEEDLRERGITPQQFMAMPEPQQNAVIIALTSASGETPPPFVSAPPPGSVPPVPAPAAGAVKGLQRGVSGYAVTPLGHVLGGRGFSGEDDDDDAADAAADRAEFVQEFAQEYAEDLADQGVSPQTFLAMHPSKQNAIIIPLMRAEGEAPPPFLMAAPAAPPPAAPPARMPVKPSPVRLPAPPARPPVFPPRAIPSKAIASRIPPPGQAVALAKGGRRAIMGQLNGLFSGAHLIR